MKTQTYHLEFLTPCFCAGANQNIAEVRPPSIRGKLRWWFRVVGGTIEQESEVFGSISGETGLASSLIIRVSEQTLAGVWQPIHASGMSNTGYLLFFAQKSAGGARWAPGGAIPKGTKFTLSLVWRRKVSDAAQLVFELALKCFLTLGTLGLRSSRGLGAFECSEMMFNLQDFEDLCFQVKQRSAGLYAGMGEFRGGEEQWLEGLGGQLRGLRKGYPASIRGHSNPTPLGSSQPRQASAVYLRPVRENGFARIAVFEAPAERVLSRASQKGAPRTGDGIPAPEPPPQRSGRSR